MKTIRLLLTSLLLSGLCMAAHSQTLDFTLSASSSDGATVVPKLSWSTTPAATSCTASGDAAWSGSKTVSGTQTLAGVSTNKSYVMQCSWPGVTVFAISWTPPTTNVDGSPYTDPNGVHIQYGTSVSALNTSLYLNQAQSVGHTWTSPALAPGTWFVGVKAVNSLGLESAMSNIASKTLTAGATQSRTLGLAIQIPGAPVLTIE